MSAEHITSGTVPQRGDTLRFLLIKEVNATGGAGGGVSHGNYGGVAPPFTPSSGAGVAFDDITGQEWSYWGGAWH